MSRYEAEIVLYDPNVITNMFKENMSVKLESNNPLIVFDSRFALTHLFEVCALAFCALPHLATCSAG